MEVFILIFVLGAALVVIARVLFWVWVGHTVWKGAREAQRYYNAQVEYQLRQIAMAIQQQQIAQAQALAEAARRHVTSLPRQEQRVYQHKLSDVVRGRRVLNPATGEWEES